MFSRSKIGGNACIYTSLYSKSNPFQNPNRTNPKQKIPSTNGRDLVSRISYLLFKPPLSSLTPPLHSIRLPTPLSIHFHQSASLLQIGRASCSERILVSQVAGLV